MTAPEAEGGVPIVLTAPLTEIIDHAGYFIQMSMASLPIWLEGIINRKYPKWRDVEYNDDGSARSMPAGIRVLETSLLRRFPASDVVCCYPADLDKFIGPNTRVVAVSTHNPLGVTFAAGVYTSIFGSSRMPINSHYSRELFATIKGNPPSRSLQGDCRRIGRLADRSDQQLRRAQRRLHRRGPQRIGGDAASVRQGAQRRGTAAPRSTCSIPRIATASSFPTTGRRSASSR